MLLHIHFVKVDHETLLVVGSLGVQLSAAYASGRESTTFIEMSRIKDIVINEAIHMVRRRSLFIRDVTNRNPYVYISELRSVLTRILIHFLAE